MIDVCVYGGRERERERGTEGDRERESVYVCVDGFIVECPPPPLSVYLAIRAIDQVRRFISIHLHYITFTFDSPVRQGIFLPQSTQ